MPNPYPLGPMLGRCAHLAKARLESRLIKYDITPVQTHVLLYLFRHGGEAPQSEVTAFLKVKPSTANGVLDRMEEKHLLCRSVSPTDARQKLITLTQQGKSQQALFRAEFDSFEAALVSGLSQEEQAAFRGLLGRIISNLEEDDHS